MTLAQLRLDAASLAAALLHDVPENCRVPIINIETHFGSEVAKLVNGVIRLGKISWAGEDIARRESQANNQRKMLVAMAEDIRVVFIKLADFVAIGRGLVADPELPDKIKAGGLDNLMRCIRCSQCHPHACILLKKEIP